MGTKCKSGIDEKGSILIIFKRPYILVILPLVLKTINEI